MLGEKVSPKGESPTASTRGRCFRQPLAGSTSRSSLRRKRYARHTKKLTACPHTVAAAAPAMPKPSTQMNSQSSTMLDANPAIIAAMAHTAPPMLRMTGESPVPSTCSSAPHEIHTIYSAPSA